MAFHKSGWCVVVLAAACLAGPASLAQVDPSPPASPVKVVFLHHSMGENWLRDAQQGDDTAGGLGVALAQNNYFVSDMNYGWDLNGIGDRTDIGNWWEWFRGPDAATITAAVYADSGQNRSYTRLASDPGGENQIVVLTSCFPNSNLGGNPSDPIPAIGENALRGQDASSEYRTVANAKGIYLDLLNYFATRTDKLFVIICVPPLQEADTGPEQAANARALNDWLVNHLLDGYTGYNVAVFDFCTVLTSNSGSPPVNDQGATTGNHYRWRLGQIEHGGGKALGEFPALLNVAYHRWKDTAGCPESDTCTVTCSASAPTWAPPITSVSFSGSATPSSACTGGAIYDWEFGDGSAHSDQQNPTHSYAQEGAYSWTCTAISGTASCNKTGAITIAPQQICDYTCTIFAQSQTNRMEPLFFTSFLSGHYCTDIPTYDWDFGDGSPHGTEGSINHIFKRSGLYTVILKVNWNGIPCTQNIVIRVVTPPVISLVGAKDNPFRITVLGADFLKGVTVTLGSDVAPWSPMLRKNRYNLVLKGGDALKERYHQGQAVWISVRNQDGGSAVTYFAWP